MKKSAISTVKNRGIQTEPLKLTEPEMNAALQLIQLSGDSDSSRDINHTAGDSTSRAVIVQTEHGGEEESVGDTAEVSSSTAVNMEDTFDEVSPGPKKRKFRPVAALYQVTKPLILHNKHHKFKSR
ncbi:hypothetical protein K7X08_009077 [Anisodus acutangulus]|uniref:Uncharacterized protein n=1 Tax=Anisodus acutangulus TaxID=402998 RepID=A0A9Q1N312_9SOLA|nr:hypothetical protein K7X08_009077 [Anisodus acutangulus]